MNCSRTKQTRRKEMQMEKRTDMRAEALDTLIDIERNKKLSHIAIGETLMRNQFEKKADRAFYTRLCEGATERKIYAGKGIKYFAKAQVAEFLVQAAELNVGDKLLITGPTTGAVYATLDNPYVDEKPVERVLKGEHVTFKLKEKIRENDKLYILKSVVNEEL